MGMDVLVSVLESRNLSQSAVIARSLRSTLQVGYSSHQAQQVEAKDVSFPECSEDEQLVVTLTNRQTQTAMYARRIPLRMVTGAQRSMSCWVAMYAPGDPRDLSFDEGAMPRPEMPQLRLHLRASTPERESALQHHYTDNWEVDCIKRNCLQWEPELHEAQCRRASEPLPRSLSGLVPLGACAAVQDIKLKVSAMASAARRAQSTESRHREVLLAMEEARQALKDSEQELRTLTAVRHTAEVRRKEAQEGSLRRREALHNRDLSLVELRGAIEEARRRLEQASAVGAGMAMDPDLQGQGLRDPLLQGMADELERWRSEAAGLASAVAGCEARAAAAEAELRARQAARCRGGAEGQALRGQVEEARRELDSLTAFTKECEEEVAVLTAQREAAEGKLRTWEAAVQEAQTEAQHKTADLRNEMNDLERELVSRAERVAQLDGQLSENRRLLEDWRAAEAELLAALAEQAAAHGTARAAAQRAREALEAERGTEDLESTLPVRHPQNDLLLQLRVEAEQSRRRAAELSSLGGLANCLADWPHAEGDERRETEVCEAVCAGISQRLSALRDLLAEAEQATAGHLAAGGREDECRRLQQERREEAKRLEDLRTLCASLPELRHACAAAAAALRASRVRHATEAEAALEQIARVAEEAKQKATQEVQRKRLPLDSPPPASPSGEDKVEQIDELDCEAFDMNDRLEDLRGEAAQLSEQLRMLKDRFDYQVDHGNLQSSSISQLEETVRALEVDADVLTVGLHDAEQLTESLKKDNFLMRQKLEGISKATFNDQASEAHRLSVAAEIQRHKDESSHWKQVAEEVEREVRADLWVVRRDYAESQDALLLKLDALLEDCLGCHGDSALLTPSRHSPSPCDSDDDIPSQAAVVASKIKSLPTALHGFVSPPKLLPPALAATRRALVVGCDYASSASPLRGSVNDAWNMLGFLRHTLHYKDDQVRCLVDVPDAGSPRENRHATLENILQGLKWLAGSAQPGDNLMVFFSGYSVQVPVGGYSQREDLVEACLLPCDYAQGAGSYRLLPLATLGEMATGLPASCKLTIVLDCGHAMVPGLPTESGEVAPATFRRASAELSLSPQSRFSPRLAASVSAASWGPDAAGVSLRARVTELPAPPLSAEPARKPARTPGAPACRCHCFSSCQSGQWAAELCIEGCVQGAFTWAFVKALTVCWMDAPVKQHSQALRCILGNFHQHYGCIEQSPTLQLSASAAPQDLVLVPTATVARTFSAPPLSGRQPPPSLVFA